MSNALIFFALGSSILALIFAFIKTRWVNKQDPGTEKMQELGTAIREGAMAFLSREYRVLAGFVVAIAILLLIGYQGSQRLIALSFLVGAICSGLSGFFGMRVATASNVRTTNGARSSL
ncbi:MAG: K(+)-stimulated pyrophosphate-energized sodium pump, partial [Kiritimatiellia bacterium]